MKRPKNYCVFGAQFGSEGKGSVTEFLARRHTADNPGAPIYVIGDNGPNSGHTNSLIKTRAIPAASVFADCVMLGPDSAVDLNVLMADLDAMAAIGKHPPVYVHEHAVIVSSVDIELEQRSELVARVGSTVTGGGAARVVKFFARGSQCVAGAQAAFIETLTKGRAKVVQRVWWYDMLDSLESSDSLVLLECSQGLMLDTNHGHYPYVTSRNTHPRVVVERNGLGQLDWFYCAVFRTYPIRTGGNSGHCRGAELSWESLGLPPETASVTRRTRRVFLPDKVETDWAYRLARPDATFVTHADYIKGIEPDSGSSILDGFAAWAGVQNLTFQQPLFVSAHPSVFHQAE